MNYYFEDIIKNLPERENYCKSIEKYVEEYSTHFFNDSNKFEDLIGLTNIDEPRSVKLISKVFLLTK